VARVEETYAAESELKPWTRHCYTVRAFDASGARSPASGEACARTLDQQPPTVPAGLGAAARPDNRIQLTWQPSTDDVEVKGYEVMRGSERLGMVQGTSFTDAGSSTPREYCYAVRAVDEAGNLSAPSSPACATIPDTTPPSVPGEVTARAPRENEVRLSWAPSTDDLGVVRYELFRGESELDPIVATGTEAAETGLEVNTRHCYAVRACDAAGNCSARSAKTCVTTPDLTPPSVPSLVTARPLDDQEVEVMWVESRDNVRVTGHDIFRAGRQVGRIGDRTSFRDAGLKPAVIYCYEVRAVDAAGNRSAPSQKACATTPDLTVPTIPQRPAALPVSASQVFLAWDPSADDVGVAGYEVLRGDAVVATVHSTRARDVRLEPSTEYCYRIRAFDAAWNRSPPTAPVCAKTTRPQDLGAPSDLRVRRASATSVFLQWEPSESPGVLYRIYVQGRLAGVTGTNTFRPSGRLGAESNCYQIVAVDPQGRESPKSNEICARLDSPLTLK
jgi:chitodextrinase